MSVKILVGDARAALRTLPDESVDCCITSPPYLGLRDYRVEGQIGREGSVAEYVAALVDVFREVRRVLRPQGVAFLNLGDAYAGSGKGLNGDGKHTAAAGAKQRTNAGTIHNTGGPVPLCGLKPKDLMLVPSRVAIALQDDGWWVRSEIIWGKPNPMPESVKSRPSTAHEKIWMLTKSGRHFYGNDAAQVPVADSTVAIAGSYARRLESGEFANETKHEDAGLRRYEGIASAKRKAQVMARYANKQDGAGSRTYKGFNARWRHKYEGMPRTGGMRSDGQFTDRAPATRRLRNYEEAPMEVWRFSPAQYKDAHFATFPPELVERCLAIGAPEGGTILDPFGGAGTTGLVADYLGYDAVLAELNPEYADLAVERIRAAAPLTADVRAVPVQEALL